MKIRKKVVVSLDKTLLCIVVHIVSNEILRHMSEHVLR